MRGLPTYCTRCGHIFELPFIKYEGGHNNSFINIRTNCIKCGGLAVVGDGTYSAESGNITLDSGPEFTKQLVDRLQEIIRKAEETSPDVHDFLAEVAEVSPEFSQALRKYDRFGLHILILLMLFVLKSCDFSVKADLNQLVDQGWHMVQGEDPNFHELPKSAPTVPPAPDDARLFLTSGYQPAGQANRRQRRQAQAQSRKRAKRP